MSAMGQIQTNHSRQTLHDKFRERIFRVGKSPNQSTRPRKRRFQQQPIGIWPSEFAWNKSNWPVIKLGVPLSEQERQPDHLERLEVEGMTDRPLFLKAAGDSGHVEEQAN
jgi:hypothetical protein